MDVNVNDIKRKLTLSLRIFQFLLLPLDLLIFVYAADQLRTFNQIQVS